MHIRDEIRFNHAYFFSYFSWARWLLFWGSKKQYSTTQADVLCWSLKKMHWIDLDKASILCVIGILRGCILSERQGTKQIISQRPAKTCIAFFLLFLSPFLTFFLLFRPPPKKCQTCVSGYWYTLVGSLWPTQWGDHTCTLFTVRGCWLYKSCVTPYHSQWFILSYREATDLDRSRHGEYFMCHQHWQRMYIKHTPWHGGYLSQHCFFLTFLESVPYFFLTFLVPVVTSDQWLFLECLTNLFGLPILQVQKKKKKKNNSFPNAIRRPVPNSRPWMKARFDRLYLVSTVLSRTLMV